MHQRQSRILQPPPRRHRVGIAIQRDQPAVRSEPLQNQSGVPSPPERRVDVNTLASRPAGIPDGQRIHGCIEKDGSMDGHLRGHSEKLSVPGGGVVLNNSSVHEIIPKPKYLSYSVSKGGMENLTKSLALEYAGQGIRVNAVGPGAVVTPINRAWIDNPKARGEVESHIPMGRAAQACEIASVFAFLASDEASYVTGQTIFACGGLTLYPEFRVAWSSGE